MKFRKLSVLVLSLIMMLAMSITAFAATEDDIIKELKAAGVPDTYVAQAEQYLANNDVTADQADGVIDEIKAAKATAGDVTDVKKLNADQKAAIIKNVEAAGKAMDAVVTVDTKNNKVTITDKNGKEYVVEENPVKPTGVSVYATYAVVAAMAMVLVACGVVVSKRRAA